MADIKELTELKKQVETAQRKADQAEGGLKQVLEQLKSDFECSSIKQAEKKLSKLQKDLKAAEVEFDAALEEFEEEWGDKI